MRVFLSIKYYNDMKNNELIENITNILMEKDIETFVFSRDIKDDLTPKELMKRAFEEIDKSDILIIEATELSIGIGIEAGYAYTKNIPIYLVANKNAYVSNTIKGISEKQIYYENLDELKMLIKDQIIA